MKLKTHKSRFTLNHFILIILSFVIAVQVYISNKIATSGQKLKDLEQQAQFLEKENQNLLSESLSDISLHELAEKAQSLGFVQPEKIYTFTHPFKIAYND